MKKYFVYKVAVLLLCTALLTGCGQKDKDALPEDFPIDFVFSSGVGAWATSMTLEQDGAFSGAYYDADMGVYDEDYPNGTVYICDFSGRFSDIEKVDEYSYSLTLAGLDSDYEAGKEWIENGTKNISSEPYGMEDGDKFILYLPDTPIDGLDEGFLSWWPGRYALEGQPETLEMYGLYNVKMGYGFFG